MSSAIDSLANQTLWLSDWHEVLVELTRWKVTDSGYFLKVNVYLQGWFMVSSISAKTKMVLSPVGMNNENWVNEICCDWIRLYPNPNSLWLLNYKIVIFFSAHCPRKQADNSPGWNGCFRHLYASTVEVKERHTIVKFFLLRKYFNVFPRYFKFVSVQLTIFMAHWICITYSARHLVWILR
jgi:hypothetical protein